MYDFSNHATTHNASIDMCGNIIGCARKARKPIKALHLSPIYYEWFKSGIQTLMNRPLEDGELLQFDGVNIEKGTKFQQKPVIIEYYEQRQVQS